jgi:hypothetical protein
VAETVFGGMPQWLLEEYLLELGGARAGDGAITGDGWRATLAARDAGPGHGGAGIARIEVRIEGPAAGDMLAALRAKAQRGGG